MKINIFGVGRSGTKAIQVYLTYILAKKNDNVWVNYEPYHWLNRKLYHRNYAGIYFDTQENFFPKTAEKLSKKHVEFLSNLGGNNNTITKFIRGHGRIGIINDLLKPDHTFIIVRDVYGVLNSLDKTGFSLYQLGKYSQINFFDQQVEDFRKSRLYEKKHESLINNANSHLRKNSLIWYFYNLYLLDYKKAYILNFSNIDLIEEYVGKKLNVTQKFSNKTIFHGHNIHTNDVFLDQVISNKRESLLSKILLYSLYRYKPYWSEKSDIVGSLVQLNTHDDKEVKSLRENKNIGYQKFNDGYLNEINSEILEKLNKRIRHQQF